MVVESLLSPSEEAARGLRTERRELLEDGRDVALELRRLVHGDLCGMFDEATTPGLDLSAPLVVLDLSALYSSAALGVLMACATAWLQAALTRTAVAGEHVFLVVDEAWAILSNLGVARWLQSSWKLSRALGVSNVAVLHRVSDLRSVGASDSEQVALAQGLLADSETRVVYAQSPGELAAAAELLSLSSTETELLPQLRRGIALWKVGQRSFLVQHRLSAAERRIVDTDGAMSGSVRGRSRVPVPGRADVKATDPAALVLPLALGALVLVGIGRRAAAGSTAPRSGAGRARRGARWACRRDLRALAVRPGESRHGPPHSGRAAGVAAPHGRGRRGRAVPRRGRSHPERQDVVPGRAGDPGVARARGRGERQERPAAQHHRALARRGGPCGASTRPAAAARAPSSWSPLSGCSDWHRARRVAADLCEAGKSEGTTADGEFWYATAAKLLAPLLLAAALDGRHHGRRGSLGRHPRGGRGGRDPRTTAARPRPSTPPRPPGAGTSGRGARWPRRPRRCSPPSPSGAAVPSAGGPARRSNPACSSGATTPCTCARRPTTSAACAGTSPR